MQVRRWLRLQLIRVGSIRTAKRENAGASGGRLSNLTKRGVAGMELFTQPLSPYSAMMKHVRTTLGVPFVERDVVGDREARKEFWQMGASLLPVLRSQDTVSEGFHPQKLRGVLLEQYGVVTSVWVDGLIHARLHRLVPWANARKIFVMSPINGASEKSAPTTSRAPSARHGERTLILDMRADSRSRE